MTTANASVNAGYNWVFDSEGKCLITAERLNLAAVPVVTVPLTNIIMGEDIVDAQIDEYALASTVRARLLTATITVAAEVSNNVDVSIQFKDCLNSTKYASCCINLIIADTATYTPGTLPTGGAPTILTSNGFILNPMTSGGAGLYAGDHNGLLKLRFTNSGAATKYIYGWVQNVPVAGSGALIWT